MSDKLTPELMDFIQIIDDIYGLYLDATAAFVEWRKLIVNAQHKLSRKKKISERDLDNEPFGYGEGDADPSQFNIKHIRTQSEIKERLKKGGVNFQTMANLCIVLINEYWNSTRTLMEKKHNLPHDSIKSDLMGDIRYFRNSILKNRSIGNKKMNKCRVLKWFKEGDPIAVSEMQFEEIITKIKQDVTQIDISTLKLIDMHMNKLKEIANKVAVILNDNFVGFYVSGSITMGDWNPQKSDVDFGVVTKKPLNKLESDEIRELHQNLLRSDLGRKLEGEYVDLCLLQKKEFNKLVGAVNQGVFTPNVQCQISADNVFCMIQFGRCIKGMPIKGLNLSVTDDELIDAVYGMLVEDRPVIDTSKDFQTLYYILINSLRCIYTIQTMKLPTKQEAVEHNRTLIGDDLYQRIMDYMNNKLSEFEIDKNKLKSIIDYGISLKRES